jgi:hypothetical protein
MQKSPFDIIKWGFQKFVGVRGFEPPISGPPDQHFNRTKLHPVTLLPFREGENNLLDLIISSLSYFM